MYALIDFFLMVADKLVNILNTRFFDDVNITFLQLILGAICIKFIIKFLTGGFKEVDTSSNFMTSKIVSNVNNMGHNNRKQQIVNSGKSDMVDVFGDGTYLEIGRAHV